MSKKKIAVLLPSFSIGGTENEQLVRGIRGSLSPMMALVFVEGERIYGDGDVATRQMGRQFAG